MDFSPHDDLDSLYEHIKNGDEKHHLHFFNLDIPSIQVFYFSDKQRRLFFRRLGNFIRDFSHIVDMAGEMSILFTQAVELFLDLFQFFI